MEALAGRPLSLRPYVDTGPVLERVFGARAGLGWVGKNSCLIDPELGSRFFLGVVLSDLELEYDSPEPDHCGGCRRCLDVCPTDAFPEPFVLDATRCISYTTIESRGAIDPELREGQGEQVFGCDLCQDVCPWNQRRPVAPLADPLALRARLEQAPEWRRPSLAWILALDDAGFSESTRGSALRRARRRGLLRNALVAAGNARDPALRPLLERHAAGDDELLAEHARWALARL
jgi:epoxyqueuosine reductase